MTVVLQQPDRGGAAYLDAELHRGAVLVAPEKPTPRFWTAREVTILREAYPVGGVMLAAANLPGRTIGSIYQHAVKDGLRAPREGDRPRERWKTTPHIDDAIRRAYQAAPRRGMRRDLAAQLMRPEAWVSERARKLGLVLPRFKQPPWVERECVIVRERATQGADAIRRALKREGFRRSETAIMVKLKRLHLSRVDPNDDRMSARELADLMGVDSKTVIAWIARGLLGASRVDAGRRGDGHAIEWRIRPVAVRRFVADNAAVVDLRKVDRFWFIDLMAGGTV